MTGLVWLTVSSLSLTLVSGSGNYYNSRYSSDGISYNSDDDANGLWGSNGYLQSLGYGSPTQVIRGCGISSNLQATCSGTDVFLRNVGIKTTTNDTFHDQTASIQMIYCQSFESFEDGTFKRLTELISLKIIDCSNFAFFEDGAFSHLTKLTSLTIQRTRLNHVPDVSNTALQILNLAGNEIKMDTHNHRGWNMPPTIKYIALMSNKIHWIPNGMVSGPNLRIASFADNMLPEIHPAIFGNVSSLIYFGMEVNRIRVLSMNVLAPLSESSLVHLNLTHNSLTFIQPKTFSQLPALKILELHSNNLKTITWDVFYDMPNLLHLDLHGNQIEHLKSNAIKNLPKLKELRLHTQRPTMKSIAVDAWTNIGESLVDLFVSDNALTTFPHQILEESYYPNLKTIYADNNLITNSTEYGEEAFLPNRHMEFSRRVKTVIPFSAYPNLTVLYLHNNRITHINTTDFCGIAKLERLYLGNNLIRDAYMDDDCFACLPLLEYLQLSNNLIQYIPDALKTSAVVPAIQQLELSGNRITFIEENAFSRVLTLRILNLNSNRVLAIENQAFPENIQNIYLQSNDFDFLHEMPFNNLSSLTVLELQNNEIQHLPLVAYEGCSSLQTLNLQGNNIPQLRVKHLEDLVSLRTLNLASNDLGWVEEGTFRNLTALSNLYMSGNKLTKLPQGDFTNKSLSTINLGNNRINVLQTNIFMNLYVSSLYLANNPIVSIDPFAFNGVRANFRFTSTSLRYIYPYSFNSVTLYGNDLTLQGSLLTGVPGRAFNSFTCDEIFLNTGKLENIGASAFHDVIVRNLHLQNNKLTSISNPMFGGASSVREALYLNSNNIKTISLDAFENVALTDIYLNDNQLSVVPQAIKTQGLRLLQLESNQITFIPLGTFTHQSTMEELHLESNQLQNIESGTFANMSSLQLLYLQNNRLQTLPKGLFDDLTSLRSLDISNNQMTYLYRLKNTALTTIYVFGNNITTLEPSAFKNLSSLVNLFLGANPLECSCELVQTLHEVSQSIRSGTCAQADSVNGIAFLNSTGGYYNTTTEHFLCSARYVTGKVRSQEEVVVQWKHPDIKYWRANHVTTEAIYHVTYTVICTTPLSAHLTGVLALEPELTDVTNATQQCNETQPSNDTINGTQEENNITNTAQESNDAVNWTQSEIFNGTQEQNNATGICTNITNTNVNALLFSEEFNLTFTSANGVQAGTTYECSVKLQENEGNSTALSNVVRLVTPDATVPVQMPGPDDIELAMLCYDFSSGHEDFNGLREITYTNATFVDSPYGAWLSISNDPTADTFSDWFRVEEAVNFEINTSILMEYINAINMYRYWSPAFFPVDGDGFGAEYQRDCNSTYRNFGFTSTIRTGMTFGGSEVITVSGGEALWLFTNKIKIVEHISSNSSVIPCFVIDLSPAKYTGGLIYVKSGILSDGNCTALETSTTGIALQLELGVTYHFDLYLAETKRCSSEFLLQVENVTFHQNKTTSLPLDYDVNVDEDIDIGDTVTAVNLQDVFAEGPFKVTIYSGNEQRRFSIEDDTYTYSSTPAIVPIYSQFIDGEGNIINYLECSGNVSNVSLPYDDLNETFSINTTSFYVTLTGELDYETETGYYLLMSVEDIGKALTGYISVRILIADVNDNCPSVISTSTIIFPRPVLTTQPLLTFTTTDADSGRNAEIYYVVSEIAAELTFGYFIVIAAVKSIAAAPKNYEGGISTVSSVSETQGIRVIGCNSPFVFKRKSGA